MAKLGSCWAEVGILRACKNDISYGCRLKSYKRGVSYISPPIGRGLGGPRGGDLGEGNQFIKGLSPTSQHALGQRPGEFSYEFSVSPGSGAPLATSAPGMDEGTTWGGVLER